MNVAEPMTPYAFYWILFIFIAILSYSVQGNLNRKFKKYSKVPTRDGSSGYDVACRMLSDHGISNVKVTCVDGQLTDHYNPENNTVNLSKDVYYGRTMMDAAVAAHECGHAVQHQEAYAPLQMRSALVPVVSFAGKWVMWILLIGMLTINAFPQLMLIGIGLFALTTLFSFITLPVEVNASQRAVNWLQSAGITDRETTKMASDALHSAAYTYVVAALSSLATLLYYVMIFMGGRRK